jgi:hypothetical protein
MEIAMKRIFLIFVLAAVCCLSVFPTSAVSAMAWPRLGIGTGAIPTFGIQRDWQCFNQFYEAPCFFPPADNPCAVECRPPGIQEQSVPCAFDTACPAGRFPCHGVSYGANPYPIFRMR